MHGLDNFKIKFPVWRAMRFDKISSPSGGVLTVWEANNTLT
jgi:hypothetical protein